MAQTQSASPWRIYTSLTGKIITEPNDAKYNKMIQPENLRTFKIKNLTYFELDGFEVYQDLRIVIQQPRRRQYFEKSVSAWNNEFFENWMKTANAYTRRMLLQSKFHIQFWGFMDSPKLIFRCRCVYQFYQNAKARPSVFEFKNLLSTSLRTQLQRFERTELIVSQNKFLEVQTNRTKNTGRSKKLGALMDSFNALHSR